MYVCELYSDVQKLCILIYDFQKPTPLPKVISVPVPVKSTKVAAVFGDSDDDEPEEMPPECKMRMKNVGRYAIGYFTFILFAATSINFHTYTKCLFMYLFQGNQNK